MILSSLKKIYFLIATLFGLGWTVIWLWIAIHQVIMINWISDEEYLSSNDYYRYQCDTINKADWTTTPRSEEDKATCIQEERNKMLSQRAYNSKESIISGMTRGIIFLIVFATHAHIFFKKEN